MTHTEINLNLKPLIFSNFRLLLSPNRVNWSKKDQVIKICALCCLTMKFLRTNFVKSRIQNHNKAFFEHLKGDPPLTLFRKFWSMMMTSCDNPLCHYGPCPSMGSGLRYMNDALGEWMNAQSQMQPFRLVQILLSWFQQFRCLQLSMKPSSLVKCCHFIQLAFIWIFRAVVAIYLHRWGPFLGVVQCKYCHVHV